MQTGTPNAGTSQIRPHVEQFCGSTAPSTHWPLHSVSPASQLERQAPLTHAAVPLRGFVHAWSQTPQCASLLDNCTQAPPHATSELGHVLAHAPLAQTWPVVQALPHAPQFAESASTFAQPPLHGLKPSLHTLEHTLAWHTARALAATTQRAPQLPQLLLSASRSTQFGPQRSSAVSHTKLQEPPTQTGAAEAGAVHATAQPPQF